MKMDSKVVNKSIRQIIKPVLVENGFTKFNSRNAWKYTEFTVQQINFQSFNNYLAHGVGCTTYSFAINLYVRYKFQLEEPYGGSTKTPGYSAEIEKHLQKKVDQATLFHPYNDPKFPFWEKDRKATWYVKEDGSNLVEVIEDAKLAIMSDGIPWLEEMSNVRHAYKIIQTRANTEEERYAGNLGSPLREAMLKGFIKFLS